MIKYTLTLALLLVCSFSFAQDNIIFKNGDDVKGKVLEVTDELVKFIPADNLGGPTYSYKKSEIFMIKYENGKKDIFNEKQNTGKNNSVIYSASIPDQKPNESVFSFMLRTGWEYSHHHEKSIQYSGYPGMPYNTYFAITQNDFYMDILAGKRRKHYQFGGGLSIYMKDVKVHYAGPDYINGWVDSHTDDKGIGMGLVFSNKIYFIDKKFTPFIMGDGSLLFDNVIEIGDQNQYNYSNNYGYYYENNETHFKFTFGAGVEIKTKNKCKIQLEMGVRLIPEYSDNYNRSAFHTGLSFVF